MKVAILGTRGIPASHGGFETFAEHLARYLVDRGWRVTVYCQQDGVGPIYEDEWCNVRRVHVPVRQQGARGTVVFDWKATIHAAREPQGVVLTLGYNTAVFCAALRMRGIRNVINMDGLEWLREKWSRAERTWFYVNEWLGCWLGNHLVADHPEIKEHLATRVSRDKITTISYGANEVTTADASLLEPLGLQSGSYGLVIARPEPENSILEVVRSFSKRRRDRQLVVLGRYHWTTSAFHSEVKAAASDEVVFPGAIYESPVVEALRFHARLYVHGHTVGGTNPSLVEALGAGSPVLAQDNKFNRWVAGPGAHYFADEKACLAEFDQLLDDDRELQQMREASTRRFREAFTWDRILSAYEELLLKWMPR